jgi:LysM repeat protein
MNRRIIMALGSFISKIGKNVGKAKEAITPTGPRSMPIVSGDKIVGKTKGKPGRRSKKQGIVVGKKRVAAQSRRDKLKGAGVGAGAVGAGVGTKEALDSGDTGPSSAKADSKKSYRVKKGDTLSEIAMEHGVTVRDLMRANPSIKNKDKIKAGQVIKIPKDPPLPTRPKPQAKAQGGKIAKRSAGGRVSKNPRGYGKARSRNSSNKLVEGYKEGGQV